MDWITGIQRAIDYVEDNLTETINYDEVAKKCYSSSYHFQRVFSILCGFTLGEYIRNRRLTLAGRELATTNAKVIDVALRLYLKLYEDNSSGKVTDEWFMCMSHKYEVERVELKAKIPELRNQIGSLEKAQKGKEIFIAAIRKFMQMETLTAPLLHELIDRIEVHEIEGTGKNRTQRIVIQYRFVGYLELPTVSENYKADIRQGVAIEYLTA